MGHFSPLPVVHSHVFVTMSSNLLVPLAPVHHFTTLSTMVLLLFYWEKRKCFFPANFRVLLFLFLEFSACHLCLPSFSYLLLTNTIYGNYHDLDICFIVVVLTLLWPISDKKKTTTTKKNLKGGDIYFDHCFSSALRGTERRSGAADIMMIRKQSRKVSEARTRQNCQWYASDLLPAIRTHLLHFYTL